VLAHLSVDAVRLKPHLLAHAVSEREVALIGERQRFALRGKIYAALIPLLDGSRSADEIAAALDGRHALEEVYYALLQLEAKGYVEPNHAGLDSAAASWWSAQGIKAHSAIEALSNCPVMLHDAGANSDAIVALAASLGKHFRITRDGASAAFVLVATDDYLDPRLARAVAELAQPQRRLLPVRLAGAKIWLGPLIEGSDLERFTILLTRLADNRPTETIVMQHGAQFPLVPAQGLPLTFELAASWASSALLPIIAAEAPSSLREGVLTLDPWTLETNRHAIVFAPRTASKTAPAIDEERTPIELKSNPKRYTLDGGHRVCPPGETLARLESFVSPITGIIPTLEKLSALEGMHVYVAAQATGALGLRLDFRANRKLGRPLAAAGKGASDTQAKVSCLAEAIERYSCGFFGDELRRSATLDELGDRAVDPRSLLAFSESQYAARQSTNATHRAAYARVPMKFDPERETDWTPAWSLTRHCTRWLASTYCYFGFPKPAGYNFCGANSNGCASGNTIEEAILQGALELIERDACAIWWYNRIVRPGIDLASFADPYFEAMAEALGRDGRTLEVLDLTNDVGVIVVIAVSWQKEERRRTRLGLGCHLEPRIAISRALSELAQSIAFEFEPGLERRRASFGTDARWLDEQAIDDHPYLRASTEMARIARDFTDLSSADVLEDVRFCVARFEALGLETIVLEHTRPEIGFPVARVVVPDLRHFWPRFAPGRLYDVPPRLGWLKQPLAEAELHPVPFFF
jgi:ribosomal protein S12 methylthiotransferase accessory factor